MTDQKPLISVILPAYNAELYLGEAIESLTAQSYELLEIIVVDDGSTDATADVVRQFGDLVRYEWQSHQGCAAARNRGLSLAKGSFFGFIDSDDLWPEDRLTLQMRVFETRPELDYVSGFVEQFPSPDLTAQQRERLRFPDRLVPGQIVGAMLIRRESFFKVGLFDTQWRVGEVMNWYLRAAELGLASYMLPDCVYRRRLHAANKGITGRQFIGDRIRILKDALDRRRS